MTRANTVLAIEHNLDVIKMADRTWVKGPEGGDGGGIVVVSVHQKGCNLRKPPQASSLKRF